MNGGSLGQVHVRDGQLGGLARIGCRPWPNKERADKASGRLPTPIGPGSLGITVKHESRHAGHDPVGLSHAMRIRRASQAWDWDACLNPDLDYGYGSMARADC